MSYQAPLRDMRFVLHELFDISGHCALLGNGLDRELIDGVLEEGARYTAEVVAPLNRNSDEQGCLLRDGQVSTPDGFAEAYQQYVDNGWASMTGPSEYGGQALPQMLACNFHEMLMGASLSFRVYSGLTEGAVLALYKHGSEALKDAYLAKLVSGQWTGTMCLTEPQAGTDLALLRTKAEAQADGSYKVSGSKIFISGGEQDLSENIIHLVLARLPDAPKGVKGISLFVVPKVMVNADGSLGERNALSCAGIEHKMGIHASPTCVMNYDGAIGHLVGEPHKGLTAMFVMMNTARLYVGMQGLGVAESAYQNALAYAQERPQGRALKGAKFPDKPADPITVHPDVRRMIYTMKAFTEGSRALVMLTALHLDIAHRHSDPKMREASDDFVQLVTPIVKSYLTDGGFETASTAMQCFGGYGYIEEYGASQYLRDSRIAMIYEGTNGVQAMDLVGRKLPFDTGRYLSRFFLPVDAFIAENRDDEAMAEFNKPLKTHLKYLQQATMWIGAMGLADPNHAGAGAVEYQKMFALVLLAYIWAKQAKLAMKLRDEDPAFYDAKLATARFYFAKILPGTISLLASITAGSETVMADGGF